MSDGSRPPEAPDESEAQQSLARIEAGDIPLSAERRLRELGAGAGAFTSDLSIADLALCRQVGLRPLAQVMGSSIYQVGYQETELGLGLGRFAVGGSVITELGTLSHAWNEARELALGRLAREARAVGADAVVGVALRADARAAESGVNSGTIEYSVVGTAVAREGSRSPEPVLTELSVSEYAKLVAAGIEPAGIVGSSSVFAATFAVGGPLRLEPGLLGATQNFEMTQFTEGFYAAREQVMSRMGQQARRLDASGIVGVRISHSVSDWATGTSQAGVMATFHAIGTAVRDEAQAPPPKPKTTIDLTI